MQPSTGAINPGRLAEVLLEFGRAPGNYPVRLGEPRELHSQLDTMASWALGRVPGDLKADAGELRDAAVLFILRACFAPDSTHYQVLGLTPQGLTPETLRTRYRALIRLTHPDMGVQGLPPNAAGIVNRAQEVLSDTDLREQYDERLARSASDATAIDGVTTVRRIEHRISLAERWRSLNARFPTQTRLFATAIGVSLLVVVLLVVAAREANDGRTLIVRGPDDGALIGAAGEPMVPQASPSSSSSLSPSSERRSSDERRGASSRQTTLAGTPQERVAPGDRARESAAAPARLPASPAPPPAAVATAPGLRESWSSMWGGGTTKEQPDRRAVREEPTADAGRRASESAAGGTSRSASGRAAPPAAAATASAAVAPADPAPTGRSAPGEPSRATDSRGTRLAAAPPDAPGSAPSRRTELASSRSESARTPAVEEAPPTRAASTAPPLFSTGRSDAGDASMAANTAATRSAPAREPEPTRSASGSSPPAGLPATTSRVASANAAAPAVQTPVTSTQAVFQVDSPNAKNYLVRLISSLERPGEARIANNYLADQKVVGSLLFPALQLMTTYPDVIVERMRWTDSERPGVLKVQGSIVLFAHSPQATVGKRVSYRLSAEFLGTATGTVLAELDLKESQ